MDIASVRFQLTILENLIFHYGPNFYIGYRYQIKLRTHIM